MDTPRKCLICLSEALDELPGTGSNEILQKLSTLFKISNSTTCLSRNSRSVLCCLSCITVIEDTTRISNEINRLQLYMGCLTQVLKRQLRRSFLSQVNGRSSRSEEQRIRQTFVQCWAPCRVTLNQLPTRLIRKELSSKSVAESINEPPSSSTAISALTEPPSSSTPMSVLTEPPSSSTPMSALTEHIETAGEDKTIDQHLEPAISSDHEMFSDAGNDYDDFLSTLEIPPTVTSETVQETGTKKKRRSLSSPFTNVNEFTCIHCQKLFKKEQHWKEVIDGSKTPECKTFQYCCNLPDCTRAFASFSNLKRHHVSTCPSRPRNVLYPCEFCPKKCTSSGALKRHTISFHTKEYPFCCDKCGLGVVDKPTLERHMLTHSSRDFTCNICSRTYKRKDALMDHKTTHDENKFICSSCGKGFPNKKQLHAHESSTHKNDAAKCPICDKEFKCIQYVRAHIYSTHQKRRKPKLKMKVEGEEEANPSVGIVIEENVDIREEGPAIADLQGGGKTGLRGSDKDILKTLQAEDADAVDSLLTLTSVEISFNNN